MLRWALGSTPYMAQRVNDAENSIYEGLRGLAWRPYLAAMWILCGELQTLYADEFSDAERSLIPPTMDVVREVAAAGESAQLTRQAAELAEAWGDVRTERVPEASSGLMNFWATFEGLVQEIAGITPRYHGAEWVTNTIIEPWREGNHRNQGPILLDPNAEIADDSPTAHTLALFQHIVAEVARAPEDDWEPRRLRAQVFRGR
jgi:hypothetical protein